jgi:hypothetical protein
MNPAAVDWLPPLIVLGIGIVVGAFVVWRVLAASRRQPATASAPALEVRDLSGKSEALLRQLRELEDTASKRTAEQLARERYALELEAARTFLALDERAVATREMPRKSAPREPAAPNRAGMRGFLWGIGTATGLLLLGFFVYQSAKPRAPGGAVTGEVGMSGRNGGESAAPDAEEAELQAAVARNPQDIEGRLALARLYVQRQDWMQVWNETSRVLEQAPGNPRASAYQALVRLAMGQGQVAVNMLTTALAADPDMVEAGLPRAIARAPGACAKRRRPWSELRASRAGRDFAASSPSLQERATAGPGGAVATRRSARFVARDEASAPTRGQGRGVSGTIGLIPRGAVGARASLVFARQAGGSEGAAGGGQALPAVFPRRSS